MTEWQKTVTYSPHTKKFYVGSHDDGDFAHDSIYEPIAKLNVEKEFGNGRIEPINYEMFRDAERKKAQGNIDATSLANITVVDLLSEVIRREWRKFNAIMGVRRIPVPKLQLKVAIAEKYAASKKVPQLVAPDQKKNKFTQVSFDLWKNMVDLFESDESRLKGTIEPLNFEIDQAAGALAQAANEQIITEIRTLPTQAAAGVWTDDTNNPLLDLETAWTAINNTHFVPDTLAVSGKGSVAYLSNDNIKGLLPPQTVNVSGTYPIPAFPDVTAIVDPGFTATEAILYDKNGMLLGEGPMVAEQFRDPHRSADGWVIRQWLEPKKTTNDIGKRITGVTS